MKVKRVPPPETPLERLQRERDQAHNALSLAEYEFMKADRALNAMKRATQAAQTTGSEK